MTPSAFLFRCPIFLLALAVAATTTASAQEKAKGIRQTRESVPWAMAGHKFIEFYYGKEGHRNVYEGQPVTVTALVSSIEVSARTGEIALILQDDRIMVLPANGADPQFTAVRSFFEREKAQVRSKPAEYQNFYVKATVRGTCAASKRANKVDLRDATVLAWYGVRALRVGRGLSIDIAEKSCAEQVPLYQRMDWEQERQQRQGGLKRLQSMSRQFIMTLDKTPYVMDADPLSLATEAWKICELCKVNAITSPLELTVAAYPADALARRFVETSITAWRPTNPLLMVYDVVNNIGATVDLQPPISADQEEAEAVADNNAGFDTESGRKLAQSFAIAANNLLAGNLDSPKGLLYLAVAEFIINFVLILPIISLRNIYSPTSSDIHLAD
jgi:hypothetical protein